MANFLYNTFKKRLFDGTAKLTTISSLQAMLVNSSYTPNPDHTFVDSGSGANNPKTNEIGFSGTGYGRQTLANKAAYQNDGSDYGWFDCDDIVFGARGATSYTAAGLIIFVGTTFVDTTSPLVAFFDSGFPKSPASGQSICCRIDATGLIHIT